MNISRIAVRRPVTIAMGVAVVLLLGILSLSRLELDLLPNLRLPVVAIVTAYPGAAPSAVEGEITTPVESAIATVAGLEQLESYSVENISVVVATFRWGVNASEAMNEIQAQLATLTATLPSEAMKPVVAKVDPRLFSLMTLGVTGSDSLSDLTQIAEDRLKPLLEQLPGVARVGVTAGAKPEISVLFKSEALRANNIPPVQLYELLQYQNALVPAGALEENGVRYNVRVGNPLTSVEDIRNLVVGEKKTTGLEAGGFAALIPQMLFMKDVADVVEDTSPQQAYARVNGKPALLLQVYKQAGASSVSVCQEVTRAIPRLSAATGTDVQVQVLGNQSEFIVSALANLRNAAIVGSLLAVGVLFLFLPSWRSILVVAISIPLSVITAIILMYVGKLSLNLLSLGGLALGIGRLVDDSIVVLENIVRHHRAGKSAQEAAELGASEVALAISASTLTTLVVFLPLAYLHSTAGQWFRDMAITVTFALLASLLVAVTVVPAVTAKFLDKQRRPANEKRQGASSGETAESGWVARLQSSYARLLNQILHRPVWAWALAVALLGAGAMAPRHMPIELLPSVTSGAINVTLSLPPGTPTRITNAVAVEVEESIAAIDGIQLVWSQVGQQSDDIVQLLFGGAGGHVAKIHVLLQPAAQGRAATPAIAEEIRRRTADMNLAGGRLAVSTERLTDSLGEAYASGATVHLRGQNLEVLEEQAAQVAQAMRDAGGFIEVATSVDERQPELIFTVDRTRALLGNMTTGVVGIMLRGALTGLEATRIQRNGESIPVVLRPQPEEIDGLGGLLNFSIQGIPTAGTPVPPSVRFGRVVTATESKGPVTIQHIDRVRTIAVKAGLDGIDLGEAQRRVGHILSGQEFPAGTSAHLAGVHDIISEALDELTWVLILAIVLVYIVMAAQFESFLYPLIIMLTVPLGMAGGLVVLRVTGQSVGVSSMMGLIILTGVATSNGIIMVDAVNRARHAGADVDQAIVEGALSRLRPILMTSLTTIIGLVPLAIGRGEGTELQRPLAIAFMGGMILTTGLTLFLVPSAYRTLTRRRRPLGARVAMPPPSSMDT